MTASLILTIVAMAGTWFVTVAGVIIWAVRLEGRVNLVQAKCEGLDRTDLGLQRQIEEYRSHTDSKIDKLGDDIKAQLARIYDRLETKADKTK